MRVEETEAKQATRLMEDYSFHYDRIQNFFEYNPYQLDSWKQRCNWLDRHPLTHRAELVEGLRTYNERIGNTPLALSNVEKLSKQEAVVIIGGQQAGLMTGPMLVIHKAFTILKLAETMSEDLNRDVIPVFWIASEDHDYEEVNHTFVQSSNEIQQVKLSWIPNRKASVGDLQIPNEFFESAVEQYFSRLPDSPYKGELKEQLKAFAHSSDTLSDFFAKMMSWLFGDKGLVLVDSADSFIRKLQKPIMREFLSTDFTSTLKATEGQLLSSGYHSQVHLADNSVHLFLKHEEERKLLVRKGNVLSTKDEVAQYPTEELIGLVTNQPDLFSSNVISRPIMQESLFPVLGFVGGPGEIAYWAQLKSVFHHFDMQMPVVYPRLTFTIIERHIEKYMNKFNVSFQEACYQWDVRKNLWLMEQLNGDVDQQFVDFAEQLKEVYDSFTTQLESREPGLKNLISSNRERILAHVDFLYRKTKESNEDRHYYGLSQWEQIRDALMPLEKPQERVYNIWGYLNQYGMDLLDDLFQQNISLNPNHKLIYI